MSDDDGLRARISPADLSLLAAELGEIAASVDGVVHVRARPGFGSVVRSALQGLSAVVGGGGVVGASVPADGAAMQGDGAAMQGDGAATRGDGAATRGDGAATQADGAPTRGDGAATRADGAPTRGDGAATQGDGAPTRGDGSDAGGGVPAREVADVERADPSAAEAAAAAAPGRPVPLVGIAVADLETRITLDIAVDESGSGPLVARAVAQALLDRVSGEPVPPASVDLRIVSVATGA